MAVASKELQSKLKKAADLAEGKDIPRKVSVPISSPPPQSAPAKPGKVWLSVATGGDEATQITLRVHTSGPIPEGSLVKIEYAYNTTTSYLMSFMTNTWTLVTDSLASDARQYVVTNLEPDSPLQFRASFRAAGSTEWCGPFDVLDAQTTNTATVAARAKAKADKLKESEQRARRASAAASAGRRTSTESTRSVQNADARAGDSIAPVEEVSKLSVDVKARQQQFGGAKRTPAAAAVSCSSAQDQAGESQAEAAREAEIQRLQSELAKSQAELEALRAANSTQKSVSEAAHQALQAAQARERVQQIEIDTLEQEGDRSEIENGLVAAGFRRLDARFIVSVFEGASEEYCASVLQNVDALVKRTGLSREHVREAVAVYRLRLEEGEDTSAAAVHSAAATGAVSPLASAAADASGETDGEHSELLAFVAAWVESHYPGESATP